MERQKNTISFLTEKLEFPPLDSASDEGLIAIGGDLRPERLLLAYRSGIFPWFNEDTLILWWSPDPRMVLFPSRIKVSKSMRRILASKKFSLTKNKCFEEVIEQCSAISRKGQDGTWITDDMKSAYIELHNRGEAVSYEVWEGSQLAGGLYGIDLGHIFCGESMFSKTDNASKFALIGMATELAEQNYKLIDCQLHTEHLKSMGAEEIPRKRYLEYIKGTR